MDAAVASGHRALDRYLAEGFEAVPGMSSRFAAAICGHVVRRQTELGVSGSIAEIGTFEGRFFIAMAMLLAEDEHALGIDVFTWPDAGVYDRFLSNCAGAGLNPESFTAWKVDTRTLRPDDLKQRLPRATARFIHIDGEHNDECLSHDLELAHAVLHPDGVIALDDMLHPGYPALVVTVLNYLNRHPEMAVFCIIDRETITAAAKFLICRADRIERYQPDLMAPFARFHYVLGAHIAGRLALVLTPDPGLPKLD